MKVISLDFTILSKNISYNFKKLSDNYYLHLQDLRLKTMIYIRISLFTDNRYFSNDQK